MREADAGKRREIVRLMRYVTGQGRIGIADAGGGVLQLKRADGTSRPFGADVVRAAGAGGLVVRDGQGLCATSLAQAFLRRALIGTEDAFADQHRDIAQKTVETQTGRQAVRVNQAESPLGVIARMKEKSGAAFLPAEALEAGERLHADFTRAQLQPRLTMSYEPRLSTRTKGGSPAAVDLTDAALGARARVAAAMQAVGPELCGVALDICCFQKGLETVERERQWPARSAKLMLRAALMALARHYAPPMPDIGRRRHAWGETGYRPDAGGFGGAG